MEIWCLGSPRTRFSQGTGVAREWGSIVVQLYRSLEALENPAEAAPTLTLPTRNTLGAGCWVVVYS